MPNGENENDFRLTRSSVIPPSSFPNPRTNDLRDTLYSSWDFFNFSLKNKRIVIAEVEGQGKKKEKQAAKRNEN